MTRREVISGGLVTGMTAGLGAAPAAAQRDNDPRVAEAIHQLRQAVERRFEVSPELMRIREQQRIFLRANHRFPEYIEIGVGVWESVYDWHVRHQLPVTIARTPDGRYAMNVMETTLVLRPEMAETFVGQAFDAR